MSMTESEAKEYIQGKLDCMNRCGVFDCKGTDECDNCEYCYSQGNFGQQKKAFEMATKTLEKQIPKKPTIDEFDYGEGYVCPECESFLHYVDDDDEHIRTNYCCHCGTKIDWEGSEEDE